MTTEEKAKTYDEAIKRAKNFIENGDERERTIAESIFAGIMEESEDEKIRKMLIEQVERWHECALENNVVQDIKDSADAIEWLKKQGTSYTKKDIDDAYLKGVADTKDEIEKQYEANYQIRKDIASFIFNYRGDLKDRTKWINYLGIKISFVEALKNTSILDKFEPRFHEDEWITNGDYTWKIVDVKSLGYILQSQDGYIVDDTISHVDEQFHYFTIKDAKDGDVLATWAGAFIYNGHNSGGNYPGGYCGIGTLGNFKVSGDEHHWTGKPVFPATKEQYDTLFAKMHEAGYEWNAEKKELKHIHVIDEGKAEMDYCFTKMMNGEKVSPTWSEEDEACTVILNGLCDLAIAEYDEDSTESPMKAQFIKAKNWLKSLKERIK